MGHLLEIVHTSKDQNCQKVKSSEETPDRSAGIIPGTAMRELRKSRDNDFIDEFHPIRTIGVFENESQGEPVPLWKRRVIHSVG